MIGKETFLRDSFVGLYTSIGRGYVLEEVVTERPAVFDGESLWG